MFLEPISTNFFNRGKGLTSKKKMLAFYYGLLCIGLEQLAMSINDYISLDTSAQVSIDDTDQGESAIDAAINSEL